MLYSYIYSENDYSLELRDYEMEMEYDEELTPGNDREILILMEDLKEEIRLQ